MKNGKVGASKFGGFHLHNKTTLACGVAHNGQEALEDRGRAKDRRVTDGEKGKWDRGRHVVNPSALWTETEIQQISQHLLAQTSFLSYNEACIQLWVLWVCCAWVAIIKGTKHNLYLNMQNMGAKPCTLLCLVPDSSEGISQMAWVMLT